LTERLALREFGRDDVDELLRLDSDPRVMRYIADGKATPRAEIERALPRIARTYALYPGCGTWRASRRDTGAFVGWFTFKYVPRTVDIEVGYRLLFEAWGRGFATEGARALVDHGFSALGLHRIIGVTHPDNVVSQRVLMKCGLRDAGWGRYYDRDLRLFVAESPSAPRGAPLSA
jgi:RimJ/RimL family protein N-acetyltransferase